MFRYHFLKVKNTPTEMISPSYDCSRPQSNFGCRPKLTAVMSDIQQMGLGMFFLLILIIVKLRRQTYVGPC